MTHTKSDVLRLLPSVNDVLEEYFGRDSTGDPVPRPLVADAARAILDDMRTELLQSRDKADERQIREAIMRKVREQVRRNWEPCYRRVVNATGIILHTALGRAVFSSRALKQIQQELGGYSLLQMDLDTGKRSSRDTRIEWLLQKLTGAEAATVVNNNAAATVLVLNTIAAGKDVIVSRGHLVEIGGSFRLPEVMAASGARLVEVGTTNKTHLRDYQNAITDQTGAILRVHPSNYKIIGFSSEVPLDELVKLAHEHHLPVIDDVGAGALIDFSRFGFEYEPTLPDSLRTGADIVTSSGDKLIGAAQSGIILGRSDLIRAVRKNPWSRILRVDKVTLVVLEATLTAFLDETLALRDVPILAMLMRKPEEIEQQAQRMAQTLGSRCDADIDIMPGYSQMGSGSLPTQNLETTLVVIVPRCISSQNLSRSLRLLPVPIIARIQEEKILLDPRTLRDNDEKIIIDALSGLLPKEVQAGAGSRMPAHPAE